MKRLLTLYLAGWVTLTIAGLLTPAPASAEDLCLRYRATLIRESQAVGGINAPTPVYMAQARQESGCRADVTAWDLGRGWAQFMDGTAKQASALFPEIGPPEPYSAIWSMRAMIRFDNWIIRRVKGKDLCEKFGAALKGYNAGHGHVLRAQSLSVDPGTWFGLTEFVPTRQSALNFEYSRTYPHKILFKHQPLYAELGTTVCLRRDTE